MDSKYYGGTQQDAILRKIIAHNQLPILSTRRVNSMIREGFNLLGLDKIYRYNAFEEFVLEHPGYIKLTEKSIQDDGTDTDNLFLMYKKRAEDYNLGISTVKQGEKFCMDEGFVQQLLSTLWRSNSKHTLPNDYYDIIPVPSLIIYIDAPPETCVNRQKERNNVVVDKSWTGSSLQKVQTELSDICGKLAEYSKSKTNVLTIENTGTVEEALSSVESGINNHM